MTELNKASKPKEKRRGRGEGGVTYIESKRMYCVTLSEGYDANGKRITKSFYSSVGGKKGEATKKRDEYLALRNAGFGNISKETLGEKIATWARVFKKGTLKPSSYDRLESIIRNHIIPNLGHYPLNELTATVIQKELINKMSKKYSMSSIKKAYDSLNDYLKSAASAKEIVFNPMSAVSKPNPANFKRREIKILTDEDIRKFQTTINERWSTDKLRFRNGYSYILILNTGIRMGEALALRWSDVNMEDKSIRISRNAIVVRNRNAKPDEKRNHLIIQDTPKSRSSNRIIHLNKAALDAIEKLRTDNESEFVISNEKGGSVLPASFQDVVDHICTRAGIDRFTIHTLRHTFASKMIEAGVDVKAISEILGHSGVRITYDIYVHILDKYKKSAVNAIDFA